ncbi:MAG: hypothetical protein KJT01_07675 [Gemmatimonadetes bacterium]|nr:hypothetical protein [Gemmatimonadota bacterium]
MTTHRRPAPGSPADAGSPDPALTAALRAHYAPPAEPAYWAALEERILQQVSGGALARPARWWTGFADLRRRDLASFGMVAATLALLLAGAASMRRQARAQELAAQARAQATRAAIEATLPLPLDDVILTEGRVRLAPDAPERYLNPLDY